MCGPVKTLSYGCMHFAVAVAVAFVISGSWQVALGIGLIEPLVQTIFYVLHERAWREVSPDQLVRRVGARQLIGRDHQFSSP